MLLIPQNFNAKRNPAFADRFVAVVFLFFCSTVHSQVLQLKTGLFKTGDDAAWAAQNFNDTGWKTINLDDNWENQGYDNYNGYGWYRIHFFLPSSLKEKSRLKDELEFFLAKIDDADITYLNGIEIGKMGRMPQDVKGYSTEWNKERHYIIKPSNPALHWDAENVIAIRVYDDNGGGGVFGAVPAIHFLQTNDYVSMDAFAFPFDIREKTITKIISFNNTYSKNITGVLSAAVALNGQQIAEWKQPVNIAPGKPQKVLVTLPRADAAIVNFVFTEAISQQKLQYTQELPYILTPKEKPTPQINNAAIFGCKPAAPFLLKIAAAGKKPMQYAAENLPKGLLLDAAKGIISGVVETAGTYTISLKVKNSAGNATKKIKILIGDDKTIVTPPMGWNSWNCWGLSVSDEKVRSSANALIQSGLINHGWTYINIDDGWEAAKRAEDGSIVRNNKFPSMKKLGDYLHSSGLKFGIYSSPGPTTCGGYLGSYQHEQQDANSYASWGFDFLKYDWCSYSNLIQPTPTLTEFQKPYIDMHQALQKTGRNIVYSLCQYGWGNVWEWGPKVGGNIWRSTGDIDDTWTSLKTIGFSQDISSAFNNANYGFADPDMLTVGFVGWGESVHQTRLTPSEQYTQISLWSLLSAPLILGCDLSKIDPFTYNLLSNDEVIAVNQDAAGNGAKKIIINDELQVWTKILANGNMAVGIFNLGSKVKKQNFSLSDAGLKDNYFIRDTWRQKNISKGNLVQINIPSHGVMLLNLIKY